MRWIELAGQTNRITGVRSAPLPSQIGPAYASDALNLRFEKGLPQCRKGSTRLLGPPVAGGIPRGSWEGYFVDAAAPRRYVAFRIGSSTRVYRLLETAGVFSWGAEVTTVSTRFAADAFISFEVIRDTDPANFGDLLLMNNGTATVVVSETAPTDAYMGPGTGINVALDPPEKTWTIAAPKVWAGNASSVTSSNGAKVTATNSGGTPVYGIVSGQDPNNVTLEFVFAGKNLLGAADFDPVDQIYVSYFQIDQAVEAGLYTEARDFWNMVGKIELFGVVDGAAAAYHTIAFSVGPFVTANGSTSARSDRYVLLDASASRIENVTKCQLTLRSNDVYPDDFSVAIQCFAAAGHIAGNSIHAIGYAQIGSRSESVGKLCAPSTLSEGQFAMATQYSGSAMWPAEKGIGSEFVGGLVVGAGHVSVDQYAVIYRAEPQTNPDGVISYGPFIRSNWKLITNLLDDLPMNIDDTADFPNLSEYQAPPQAHIVGPGRLLLAYNGRVFTTASGILFIGSFTYPLRFLRLVDYQDGVADPFSAVSSRYPAQKVVAVAALGAVTGATSGFSPILVLTDRLAHRIEGYDSASLSQSVLVAYNGIGERRTLSGRDGAVWYSGNQREVRRASGATNHEDASTNRIDDRLDRSTARMAFATRLGYHLFYDEPDGSQFVAVWDAQTGEWTFDEFPVYFLDCLALQDLTALAWDESGQMWRLYDKAALGDQDEPIGVTLRSFEAFSSPDRDATCGLMSLTLSGGLGDVETTREYPGLGRTVTGTIELPLSGAMGRAIDALPDDHPDSVGESAILGFSTTMEAGGTVVRWAVESDTLQSGSQKR